MKTIRDIATHQGWSLEQDVLDLPLDSVVGKGCAHIITTAQVLLTPDSDGGWEPDYEKKILRAVEEQCNVWLFG